MPPLNPLNSHNEWDSLKKVVIGRAHGAYQPSPIDPSIRAFDHGGEHLENLSSFGYGRVPAHVIEESDEDLEQISQELTKLGIEVLRTPKIDFENTKGSEKWDVPGYYGYCPRDSVLVVGERAFSTPVVTRSRQTEAENIFSDLINFERCQQAELRDEDFIFNEKGTPPTLSEREAIFEAANCIRCGEDIFYLVSSSGNKKGAEWLQNKIGDTYRVHKLVDVYNDTHLDTTILPLKPGLVLLNPERVSDNNLPDYFKNWDKIYDTTPFEPPYIENWPHSSKWIGMNVLSLSPELVMVEKGQRNLISLIESAGLYVLPVSLRHARVLSGGPHCISLDLVRDGKLEDYR